MSTSKMLRVGAALLALGVPAATAAVVQSASTSYSPDDETYQDSSAERRDHLQVSEILGAEFTMPRSDKSGEIKDVMIDLKSGEVAYVVFSRDDEMYAGEFKALERGPDGELKMKKRLTHCRGIDENADKWPSSLNDHGGQYGNSNDHEANAEGHVRSRNVVRASELIGQDIENWSGEELGSLSDVVMTPGRSSSAYGILSSGGFLGMGEDLYAVSLDSIRTHADDRLVMAADVEDFEEARQLRRPFPSDPKLALESSRTNESYTRNDGRDDDGRWTDAGEWIWDEDWPADENDHARRTSSYDRFDNDDDYRYDRYGYDRSGYDAHGYDRYGYDRYGYDRDGRRRNMGRDTVRNNQSNGVDDWTHAGTIFVWSTYAAPNSTDRSIARQIEKRPTVELEGRVIEISKDGYFGSTQDDSTRAKNGSTKNASNDMASSNGNDRARNSSSKDVWITLRTEPGKIYDVLVAPNSYLADKGVALNHQSVVTVKGAKVPWGDDTIVIAKSVGTEDKDPVKLRNDSGVALWSNDSQAKIEQPSTKGE